MPAAAATLPLPAAFCWLPPRLVCLPLLCLLPPPAHVQAAQSLGATILVVLDIFKGGSRPRQLCCSSAGRAARLACSRSAEAAVRAASS